MHSGRLTKHVKRSTVPDWLISNFWTLWEMNPKHICHIPVYEDDKGFAFSAWLEEGRIGCLNWMSKCSPQACEAVLREAKASRATGLYLPGIGHVPDFPVGENDLMVEIPTKKLQGGNLRCVLFDVLRSKFSEASSAALPITIEFEPRTSRDWITLPFIQPGDHFRGEQACGGEQIGGEQTCGGEQACGEQTGTKKVLCADRRAQVSESARGIHLTFDRPIVMFAPFKYGKQRTRIGLGARRDPNIKAFDWPKKFLAVDEFDWPHGASMAMFDERVFKWSKNKLKCVELFDLHSRILVLRGIYLPAPEFASQEYYIRWGNESPSDAEYESLYGLFSVEACAARVIQRAWGRVSCDPHHKVGERVLRKRAALHVA